MGMGTRKHVYIVYCITFLDKICKLLRNVLQIKWDLKKEKQKKNI